jgi:SAM-dependent methyltransferase
MGTIRLFSAHLFWENSSVMSLGTKILLTLAKRPDQPELGSTESYTLENCLDFVRKTVPGFDQLVASKSVLDYGCGHGWQAVAMRTLCGAQRVFGLDAVDQHVSFGIALAEKYNCSDSVSFGTKVPHGLDGQFDLVLSSSAFEHYQDPQLELQQMRKYVRVGGRIVLTFAEPWYSHSGSHFSGYTRFPGTNIGVPWLNLVFSDEALLALRSRFRKDRPQRLEEIEGGLNRMTVSRFERIIDSCGMKIEQKQLFATKGLPFVTSIPIVREVLTSAASTILRKDA